jgi:hypothetical protein
MATPGPIIRSASATELNRSAIEQRDKPGRNFRLGFLFVRIPHPESVTQNATDEIGLMAGLVARLVMPGIHVLAAKTWMAGTSPAMTKSESFSLGSKVPENAGYFFGRTLRSREAASRRMRQTVGPHGSSGDAQHRPETRFFCTVRDDLASPGLLGR